MFTNSVGANISNVYYTNTMKKINNNSSSGSGNNFSNYYNNNDTNDVYILHASDSESRHDHASSTIT